MNYHRLTDRLLIASLEEGGLKARFGVKGQTSDFIDSGKPKYRISSVVEINLTVLAFAKCQMLVRRGVRKALVYV